MSNCDSASYKKYIGKHHSLFERETGFNEHSTAYLGIPITGYRSYVDTKIKIEFNQKGIITRVYVLPNDKD